MRVPNFSVCKTETLFLRPSRRLVTVRRLMASRAAVRQGAEKVFWRAEPSRDPASATAASTSPSPFRDLSHSCRLEVPRPAVPLRGAPRRGCSTRTMRTAAFRKGCWPTSVEDGLASAHERRTVDRFEVGLCGSRQQTCPPAEPPEDDGRGCTEQPGPSGLPPAGHLPAPLLADVPRPAPCWAPRPSLEARPPPGRLFIRPRAALGPESGVRVLTQEI